MLRNEWLAHLDGLVVFRGLLAAEPLRSLHAALAADEDALTGAVAAFEAALFARGTNWTEALLDAVLEEAKTSACVWQPGRMPDPVLETALNSELDIFADAWPCAAGRGVPRRGSVPAAVGDNARRRLPRGL